ncbi:MAG: hypothetical protein AAF587_19750 [Bacteroidota bacterium]
MRKPPSISLSTARLLLRLQEGESLPRSVFHPSSLLKQLLDDQVLTLVRIGKNRSTIRLTHPASFSSYLANQFAISDLHAFVATLEDPHAEKSDFVRIAGNSKLQRRHHFRGLFVKSLERISATLNQQSILISPVAGRSLFIEADQEFIPAPDCVIVGIENYENFRLIHLQQAYFQKANYLFVYRQAGDLLREWLTSLPNSYLHFGDWDPAGVCIYREEFRQMLGEERCQLFVPERIDSLIRQFGNRELYDKQYLQAKRLISDKDPQVDRLIRLLHDSQKGLEQEILIPKV